MAQVVVLMAGMLLIAESQASDEADTHQGFLSNYMPSGSDLSQSSMSDYDNFITPNFNRVKHGDGPFTTVDDKPVPHPSTQVQDSNNNISPISLTAIGIGMLSIVTMLVVRLRRGLQPATALGDNLLEMKSQGASTSNMLQPAVFFVDTKTPPRASTAINGASVDETIIGVQAPAGFFDPLDYCTTQPESFERRRAVERKHGRIAMVAMTGCLLHNADVEFPGYLSKSLDLKFSDIPNGGQGIFSIPSAGVLQILIFCGLVEIAWWPANKYDGDYGCGFFGSNLDVEEKTQKLNAEMANGRLAMLGIFGNMVAEAQTRDA